MIDTDKGKVVDTDTQISLGIDKEDVDLLRNIMNARSTISIVYGIVGISEKLRKELLADTERIAGKEVAELVAKGKSGLITAYKRMMRLIVRKAEMKMPAALKAKRAQDCLDGLAEACMVYADRKGMILKKSGNPMSAYLEIRYQDKILKIEFWAQSFAQGTGSCAVKVWYQKKMVFNVRGGYFLGPRKCVARVYQRGEWEKIVKKFSKEDLKSRTR